MRKKAKQQINTKAAGRLPDEPIYAHMNTHEFILAMAQQLLKELDENPDGKFSFGGDSTPMKNSELANEIRYLSPIGKEFLGTWFSAVVDDLSYCEQKLVEERAAAAADARKLGKTRKITISITNAELNNFEDYLTAELPKEKKEKYRRKCIDIWSRLVREWDKAENEKA